MATGAAPASAATLAKCATSPSDRPLGSSADTTATIFIAGVIDKAAESVKLKKRQAELEKLILSARNKLGNEAFASKAPVHIIQGLRDQMAKQQEELAAVEKNLAELA